MVPNCTLEICGSDIKLYLKPYVFTKEVHMKNDEIYLEVMFTI